ncbi:MAG TPA: hypothetical protein PKG56_03950, partial [Chitinophagaceae bacterium]|nr:hypothetical protein [Chitinophagaceae bacterium]
ILSTAEKLEVPFSKLLPNDSNILYQPSMNDNSIGFVHNYNSFADERKLWEALLQAKDEIIQSQKLVIATLQEQGKKG